MELEILYAIQSIRNPFLDSIMIFFSKSGNRGMIWIAIGLTFLCMEKYRKCGVILLLSLLASVVLGNVLLKHLVARERPCWINQNILLLIANPRDYSFPSGHTFSSFAAAAAIFFNHRDMGWIAFALAGMIAFSRLYLFVHYPTDVIGGVIFGIATAYVITRICNCYLKM